MKTTLRTTLVLGAFGPAGLALGNGACCLQNGLCIEIVQVECLEIGGAFQGNGTACTFGVCNTDGCPGQGDCCDANGSPGCDDAACCIAVCTEDPSCCDHAWDDACAEAAVAACETCDPCNPDAGSCCSSKDTPGCEDVDCCAAVCANDSFCCNQRWDWACADAASEICLVCCTASMPSDPPVCTATRLTDPDGEAGAGFGGAVAMDGDRAIIGSPFDVQVVEGIGELVDAGSASIARRVDGAWLIEQKLTAPQPQASVRLGNAVDIQGDVAVVGASRTDFIFCDVGCDIHPSAGAVHVFRLVDGVWTLEQTITAPDMDGGDSFGRAVSIDGGRLLIGSPYEDDQAQNAGAAYFFTDDGDAWIFQQKITAPDGVGFEFFGQSAELQGDVAVIGAAYRTEQADEDGAAYVFRRTGGDWQFEAKLTAPDGEPEDHFGVPVAICGDVIVVGCGNDDEGAEDSGAAYVFRRTQGVWSQEQKLVAPDPRDFDRFGRALAIDGGRIIVGVARDDDNCSDSGSAHVFRYDGQAWASVQKLRAFDGTEGDLFGVSLALQEDRVIVGAIDQSSLADEAGAAYVYDLCDDRVAGDVNGDGTVTVDDLVAVILAWNATSGPADLNNDCIVDIEDLIDVILNWG